MRCFRFDCKIPSKNSYSKHFDGQFLQIVWKAKYLKPLRPSIPFCYPLKTSENHIWVNVAKFLFETNCNLQNDQSEFEKHIKRSTFWDVIPILLGLFYVLSIFTKMSWSWSGELPTPPLLMTVALKIAAHLAVAILRITHV